MVWRLAARGEPSFPWADGHMVDIAIYDRQSTEKETEDACVYLGEYISKEWACGGLGLGEGDVEGARDVGGEGVDALGCERFDVNANAVLCA